MQVLLVAAEAGGTSQTAEQVMFWILAVVAVGSALAVIAMRNIIHAALMLVLNLAAIAGMYLLLETGFLGVVQVIVYAGAIVVLFLFVIMLLGVDRDDLLADVKMWHRLGAGGLAVLVLAGTMWAFVGPYTSDASRCNRPQEAAPAEGEPALTAEELLERASSHDVACVGLEGALAEQPNGSVSFVADRLFNRYTFAFELAGLLLTVATIGAIVLGRRKDRDEDLALLVEPAGAGADRSGQARGDEREDL
ncbi:MAG TPA: NADH-quinone oxidoreductase subunit J [Nitriliruptorales bacterium]